MFYMGNRETAAIIVLFNPNWRDVYNMVEILQQQVENVIIVDNSPRDSFHDHDNFRNVVWIFNGNKGGIAGAQNVAINYAKAIGVNTVFLFDQDSVPSSVYVEEMLQAYNELKSLKFRVGSIGPQIISRQSGLAHIPKYDKGKAISSKYIRANQLISSGSLVPMEVFDQVGGLDEGLFIDCVDFEWCWRAGKRGYCHFVFKEISLLHSVGEREVHFLGFRMNVPTVPRFQYQIRNFMILCPRNYVPLYWKLASFVKIGLKVIILPFITKSGLAYWHGAFLSVRRVMNKIS